VFKLIASRASVLDGGGPPPLYHRKAGDVKRLPQSKTWRNCSGELANFRLARGDGRRAKIILRWTIGAMGV
jgi:hypothetical protein